VIVKNGSGRMLEQPVLMSSADVKFLRPSSLGLDLESLSLDLVFIVEQMSLEFKFAERSLYFTVGKIFSTSLLLRCRIGMPIPYSVPWVSKSLHLIQDPNPFSHFSQRSHVTD